MKVSSCLPPKAVLFNLPPPVGWTIWEQNLASGIRNKNWSRYHFQPSNTCSFTLHLLVWGLLSRPVEGFKQTGVNNSVIWSILTFIIKSSLYNSWSLWLPSFRLILWQPRGCLVLSNVGQLTVLQMNANRWANLREISKFNQVCSHEIYRGKWEMSICFCFGTRAYST